MTKTLIGAVLGSALLLTGAAGVVQAKPAKEAAKATRTDCFFNRQVRNYTAGNDDKNDHQNDAGGNRAAQRLKNRTHDLLLVRED